MKNVIDTTGGIEHTLIVTHIAYVELQLGAGVMFAHIVLFFLVAAENADFGQIGVQEAFEYGVTEGAGAAGDEKSLVVERHVG